MTPDREAVAKETAEELRCTIMPDGQFRWGADYWAIPDPVRDALISLRCERDKWLGLYAMARESLCSCNKTDTPEKGPLYDYTCEWCEQHPEGDWPSVQKDLCADTLRERDTALAERDIAREACKNFHGASHDLARAKLAAEAERDRTLEILGDAMVILKGLHLSARWELAPVLMTEIAKVCEKFESAGLALHDKEQGIL